jgi:predicted phosphodiesterase
VRVGIVSDIHCNAAGLRRAIDLMGDVDELICLGDSIWEYRFSNEVAALLRERRAHTILGNHEEGFFGPLGERARERPGSDPDLLDWLATRPHRIELERDGKRLLLVHSTPWERAARAVCRDRRRFRALRPYPPPGREAVRPGAGGQSRLDRGCARPP